MTQENTLMTVEEVANLLRISKSALYEWRYLGEGPPSFKVGGRVRYRREQVEGWLNEQAETTAA